MKKFLILLLLAASSFNSVFALDKPQSGREDKRVFYTDYKPDEIYPISAVNGLITTIIFEPGETVKNFGSGFSTAWEFAARENHFFLKPKEKQGTTNLVVVTDRRTYLFDVKLTANRSKATYRLAFRYPLEEQARIAAEAEKKHVKALLEESPIKENSESKEQTNQNRSYSMNFGSAANSKRIAPIEAFDDGRFTYLKFSKHTDFPAAYRKVDQEETLVNSHVNGDWLVLHGVFEEILLRAGRSVVGIYNDNYTGGGVNEEGGVSVPGLKREIVR